MNVCFTSTFEGTFDEFSNMMAKIHDKYPGITDRTTESAEVPYDKEGWCRVLTIANVIDFDKMQEAMTAPWVVEWDKKHNNTDVVYSMEKMS